MSGCLCFSSSSSYFEIEILLVLLFAATRKMRVTPVKADFWESIRSG